jgi:hypothetical protein
MKSRGSKYLWLTNAPEITGSIVLLRATKKTGIDLGQRQEQFSGI